MNNQGIKEYAQQVIARDEERKRHRDLEAERIVERRRKDLAQSTNPLRLGLNRQIRIDREAIKKRDGLKCRYCGQEGTVDTGPDGARWHIDHIHPVKRGGNNYPENLALACRLCNSKKNTKAICPIHHGAMP